MRETPSSALPDDVHQLVADFFQRIPFNRLLTRLQREADLRASQPHR